MIPPPEVCQRQELVKPRHFELDESKCMAWRRRLEKVNRSPRKKPKVRKESADAARRPAEVDSWPWLMSKYHHKGQLVHFKRPRVGVALVQERQR